MFYTPLPLNPWSLQGDQFLPQWRRWEVTTPDNWTRILPATRIYRTDDELDPFAGGAALHTVTSCDLARPEDMRCESSAVLALPGRVFYVSAGGVCVWTTEQPRRSAWGRPEGMTRSAVFRLPLDASAPSALKATGAPIDQLSFLEDASGHLNVLPRAQSRGEGMWNAERDAEAQTLRLGHGVERIEALGPDALLIGGAGRDLHSSSVRLAGQAELAGAHVQHDAAQGETRTHGFFFRPTAADEGLLGLPVTTPAAVGSARRGADASVLFLKSRALALQPAGELRAASGRAADDACKASCVDWYGNARPIFLGDRVLALLGYEIVEGRPARGWAGAERIEERRRVNFAPQPALAWGRD